MPIPFIVGAVVGAAAITAWNKRAKFAELDAEKVAKAAGAAVENGIKKTAKAASSVARAASAKCPCKKQKDA